MKNGSDVTPQRAKFGLTNKKSEEKQGSAYFREMDKTSEINVPLLATSSDGRSGGPSGGS